MLQKPKNDQMLPAKYSWSEVWTAALMRPNQATFEELLTDPQATIRRGALWMLLVGFMTALLLLITGMNSPAAQNELMLLAPELGAESAQSLLLTSLLCTLPIISVLAVGLFFGLVGLMHLVAQRLAHGGAEPKQYSQIAYSFSAIFAPMNLLSLLLIVVPILGFLSLFLTIYQFYLMTLALRAVYGFETREAIITMLLPITGFIVFFFLLLGL